MEWRLRGRRRSRKQKRESLCAGTAGRSIRPNGARYAGLSQHTGLPACTLTFVSTFCRDRTDQNLSATPAVSLFYVSFFFSRVRGTHSRSLLQVSATPSSSRKRKKLKRLAQSKPTRRRDPTFSYKLASRPLLTLFSPTPGFIHDNLVAITCTVSFVPRLSGGQGFFPQVCSGVYLCVVFIRPSSTYCNLFFVPLAQCGMSSEMRRLTSWSHEGLVRDFSFLQLDG